MTLKLEHLASSDSFLGRWDARWKMAALVPAAFAVALLRTLATALAAFDAALVLVLLGRVPPRWYLTRLATLVLVLGLFAVWLPFFENGGATVEAGPLVLSRHGLELAALIILKGVTVATVMLVVWVTAPLDVNLKAA